jgi:biotin synthase
MMSTAPDSIDDNRTTFGQPRHNWTRLEAQALYDLPFADLIFQAQGIHRRNFDPNHVETASLLSIKTGGCPEIAAIARRVPITTPTSRRPG